MLICILTKNVITSCSVTMMLFLHLEVKPLMTLTTVLYLSCALISGHLAMMLMELTKRRWFLLPRVARLMIHTPTAISIFVCLSMVQLMAVFISMRCTLCGHFLQVALTLILVVGYAIAAS